MRRFLAVLMLLLVPPVSALAQEDLPLQLTLPQWTLEQFSDGRVEACYTFAQAKQLKLMEHDINALKLEDDERGASLAQLQQALDLSSAAFNKEALANLELKKNLADTQADRDQAMKTAALAKSQAVYGGGKVWLGIAFIVGVAAGGYVVHQWVH